MQTRSGALEIGLIACIAAAVIAFGGTEPLVFAGVECALFLLAAVALWLLPARFGRLPWKALGLLGAFLALQATVLAARGQRTGEPLEDFLVYVAAFALAATLATEDLPRARLIGALIALGLAEAVYGFVQVLAGWQQILGIEKIFYRAQATGTYVNPNHYAGFLEMVLPLALAAAAERWDRAGRPAEVSGRAAGAFFAAVSVLLAVAVLASRSRMGVFSATCGALLVASFWIHSRPQRRARAAATAGVLLATAAVGVWIGIGPLVDRFQKAGSDAGSRLQLWEETLEMIRARPILGGGWGSFPQLYPQLQSSQLQFRVEHAHNDYLEFAVEFGLLGAGLLVACIFAAVSRAAQAARSLPTSAASYHALGAAGGGAALLVHSLADFNLRLPANALVFATLLGIAWAAARADGTERILGGLNAR